MNFDFQPIRNWFGYTRRDRRSSFILLLVIVTIIFARFLFPEKNLSISEIQMLPEQTGIAGDTELTADNKFTNPVTFDPNTVSHDTLLMLGLDEVEAGRFIRYRNKGGRFRSAGDLKKIYGLNDSIAEKLIPYVVIKRDTSEVIRQKSITKQLPRIDINRCDTAELIKLPGIGAVLSLRIIRYRQLLGGFASTEQLKEVYGLPPETFELIRNRVYADTALIRVININSADFRTLGRLPYLENYEVTSILRYREAEGRITDIHELISNKLITGEKALKVRPYLRFD